MGKDEIMKKWAEYIKDFYNDDPKPISNKEGPLIQVAEVIQFAEVIQVICQIKNNNAPGPGNITKAENISTR